MPALSCNIAASVETMSGANLALVLRDDWVSNQPWWRGAVIYPFYPHRFRDTNADDVDDLRGIIERVD